MEKGDFIKIEYVGKTESGEIFDLTSEELAKEEGIYNQNAPYKEVPLILGEGFIIPGLDKKLEEMEVGEEKEVEIEPEEGFGTRDPELVKTMPKKEFEKQDINPRPGMVIGGEGMQGRIQSVSGGRVRVDFNHPLAGKKLIYDVTITEEIEDDEEKISSLTEFFTDQEPEVEIEEETAKITTQEDYPERLRQKITGLVTKYIENVDDVEFSSSEEENDDEG